MKAALLCSEFKFILNLACEGPCRKTCRSGLLPYRENGKTTCVGKITTALLKYIVIS